MAYQQINNPMAVSTSTAITSTVTILQNATVATSNGTSLVVTGYGTAVLKITGTFVATINFEFSTDAGATWDPIAATQIGAGDIFTSTTIIGSFRITCTALDLIRARVTLTSGTVTINGRASNAINASKIVKIGTGINTIGKAYITDGTNSVGITSANIGGNETTLDRLKVNASLRMIDTTQSVGSQLVGATGTQAGGLNVNIKNTTLPVTGAFFQATQPVSGVFFQTTQPVSLVTNTPDVIDRIGRLLGIISPSTNIIGRIGIDQTTQGVTNGISVISQPELLTTGTITTTDIAVGVPSSTGVLLSGTSTVGSYVAMAASGGNASVVIGVTGLTTGTIYYEGSADSTTGIDGNWVALNMKQAGYINTQISSFTTVNGLFRGNTAGIRYIRMRSVGTLTGTPLITLRLSSGVAGEFLFGSIPTGTNTIGTVINAPSTNTIGNVNISPSVPLTTTAAAATNADLVPAIDVSAYKSVSLQILGTWTGTLTFQGCNDNVNFVSTAAENISFTGSGVVLNTANNALYHIPIKFRYLRVRMTSFASGSATGAAVAYTDDRQVLINNVNINSGTVLPVNGRGGSNNANTSSFLNSAATTNATSLKTAFGVVYSISAMNTTASVKFIRIYNLATAPTVGTSIPVMVIAIPASSSKEVDYSLGIQFLAGIAYAITGGAAATDATAVAAGDVQLAISWN